LIRTEIITADKKKQFFQEQSQNKDLVKLVFVEGANLTRNEYGSKLFADFFFLLLVSRFHVLSGVIINIIIFFNVL
jgi:cytochrome c oxidase subunit 3